jgi:hypothetical protein
MQAFSAFQGHRKYLHGTRLPDVAHSTAVLVFPIRSGTNLNRRAPSAAYLESNTLYKHQLVKIDILARYFGRIREQLVADGVSSVSLFPDLDGLAGHLQLRYFHDPKPKL